MSSLLAEDLVREAGSALIEQVSAPESLAKSSTNAVLDGAELRLLAPNCRNELARFSKTFLRPWHKSSQAPYLFDERVSEFSAAGSAWEFSVAVAGRVARAGDAADAGDAVVGLAGLEVATAEVVAAEVAGAGCAVGSRAETEAEAEAGTGTEAEGGCGASGFADTDSSKDCDAGFGFRARFTDEFSQKEILTVPSGCRTVCRCRGHWPR